MATTLIMPKVDMDQETGTVVEWIKQDGDKVDKGETILIIETDKVAIDVESPASGILQGIQAEPEDVIPIGTVIAYILELGEELPESVKTQDIPPSSQSPVTTPSVDSAKIDASPVARNFAESHNIDLRKIAGTGPSGKITKSDVQDKLAASHNDGTGAEKVFATPAARRIARERGLKLTNIIGSGPENRIQAADIFPEPVALPQAISESDVKIIKLRGIRRTIAERMTASYQTAPHISFTMRVDMSRLKEIRAKLNIKAVETDQPFVSVTALLVKAVAWTLKQHPLLNSTLKDDEIWLFPDVNLGVAVALSEGLIVPVVHKADQKSIGAIASELNDLVPRARQGQLAPIDVDGGTFTISNLGPLGIEQFTAIINPPQSAILAVGAIQPEVFLNEDSQITTHPIMRMTLSVDHRIVDGAVAAHFLKDLREVLESPELILL
jgi:pyruvate dehydrogenase E2 component (dihydrolipoamide acetyltransferase)